MSKAFISVKVLADPLVSLNFPAITCTKLLKPGSTAVLICEAGSAWYFGGASLCCYALDILNGKWKIAIMCSLNESKRRFKELQRDVGRISGKMLSKELKELEMNQLVKRKVLDTRPVTVEYELTSYGQH